MTAADGTAGSAPGDAPADEATGEPDSGTAGEPDSETAGEPDSGRSRDHSTVHLTRIYTRTGDDGTTALGDMSRTRKTSPRLAAYADVDEANSAIGVALALGELAADVTAVLTRVQNDLFDVGADLCTPVVAEPAYPPLRVTETYITRLEQDCDVFNEHLDKLNSFILPGGSAGAALLHVARTITRRAERWTWVMLEAEPERTSPLPARYLNRLSDLLFILARTANAERGDVLWSPGAGSAGAPE